MLFINFELYKFGLENYADTLKRIFEVAQTYALLYSSHFDFLSNHFNNNYDKNYQNNKNYHNNHNKTQKQNSNKHKNSNFGY